MTGVAYAHNPRTLLHIAPYLRRHSVCPVEVFRRSGIAPSALLDTNGWISRHLCFELGNQMYAATGKRFPGAAVGHSFTLADLGTWGAAVAGAPTLEQACQLAAGGIGLLHQGTDLTLVASRRHVALKFAFVGRLGSDPCQHILGSLAVLRQIALLAGEPDAVSVTLTQPSSRQTDELEEALGPRLRFGCAYDGIVMDRGVLNDPILASRPAASPGPIDTVNALSVILTEMLPYGGVTIDRVAARLRMSVRTLQRRLRDWGFSFEEMVDDIRRGEAIRRVIEERCSTLEIAFLLGYSDQAHFNRAFKRWTGLPPRDYARRASARESLVAAE